MLEVNPEHTSPIKTSIDHFTEFLAGIVKQKYNYVKYVSIRK
jgi:hypothetical protein